MIARGDGEGRRCRALPTVRPVHLRLAIPILAVAAVVMSLALLPACGIDALPTDDTGRGETEELEEALSLHELELPADASRISYTVHTSIDSHAVGLRFHTTSAGLDEVLASIGSGRPDLVRGANPWEGSSRLSSHSPERYGWDLASITNYAGMEIQSGSSLGSVGVLVDLDVHDAPVLYVEALDCC